jgi:hypothetical protein
MADIEYDLAFVFTFDALRVNANLFQTDLCRYPGYMDVSYAGDSNWLKIIANQVDFSQYSLQQKLMLNRINSAFLLPSFKRVFFTVYFSPGTDTKPA